MYLSIASFSNCLASLTALTLRVITASKTSVISFLSNLFIALAPNSVIEFIVLCASLFAFSITDKTTGFLSNPYLNNSPISLLIALTVSSSPSLLAALPKGVLARVLEDTSVLPAQRIPPTDINLGPSCAISSTVPLEIPFCKNSSVILGVSLTPLFVIILSNKLSTVFRDQVSAIP